MKRLDWAPKYIIACAILHNICIIQNDVFDVQVEGNELENPVVLRAHERPKTRPEKKKWSLCIIAFKLDTYHSWIKFQMLDQLQHQKHHFILGAW